MARAIERPSEVLPTPGGPTKQRIGPLRVLPQLAHGQVLEDAVLDLLEVVVVLVEDAAGVRDVEVVLGRGRPRQVDEPLEVGAHDGVLGRLRRDDAQALELVLGGLARLLRQVGVVDLLAQLVELGARARRPRRARVWIAFICWRR